MEIKCGINFYSYILGGKNVVDLYFHSMDCNPQNFSFILNIYFQLNLIVLILRVQTCTDYAYRNSNE